MLPYGPVKAADGSSHPNYLKTSIKGAVEFFFFFWGRCSYSRTLMGTRGGCRRAELFFEMICPETKMNLKFLFEVLSGRFFAVCLLLLM